MLFSSAMICNASTPLFMFDDTTMNTVFEGAIRRFGTEIQTQKGQFTLLTS